MIDEYDDRAGAEPLIAEAKREGLAAIPSKRFQSNMVYFQIVMLAYNLWRYLKRYAEPAEQPDKIVATVHVSRLKLLFIAATIVSHSNRVWVKYSRQLRVRKILDTLYQRIDLVRKNPRYGQARLPGKINVIQPCKIFFARVKQMNTFGAKLRYLLKERHHHFSFDIYELPSVYECQNK